MKILVRAEEFGFGPSARIAKITTELSKVGCIIDIVENKFTSLVQDLSIVRNRLDISSFVDNPISAFLDYDLVLIALDWEFAKLATKHHECVTFVDGLTWFWDEVPDCFDLFKMYWAVDFKGVGKRLVSLRNRNMNVAIVPPFMSLLEQDEESERQGYILSFGGIENPIFKPSVSSSFISSVLDSLSAGQVFDYILGNAKLSKHVSSIDVNSFQKVIRKSKGFVGTSGLGHICDLIYNRTPALFLMPVNDSQYLQSQLLPECSDQWSYIQWDELGIEYLVNFNASQNEILEKIQRNIQCFADDKHAQFLLKVRIEYFMVSTSNYTQPDYSVLANYWGYDGQKQIANSIIELVR
jgi:hypothetical protein